MDDVCAPIARQQNAFTFQNRHTQAYAYNHSEILDTAWPYPDHQSIKLSKQTITTIYVRLKVNRFCVVLRYQIHILVASFIQSTICIRTTIHTQQQHIKRSERRAECLLRFCFFSSLFIALCFVPANSAWAIRKTKQNETYSKGTIQQKTCASYCVYPVYIAQYTEYIPYHLALFHSVASYTFIEQRRLFFSSRVTTISKKKRNFPIGIPK